MEVAHRSPLLLPLLSAVEPATESVTWPEPAEGAVQSTLQLLKLLVVWVALLPAEFTLTAIMPMPPVERVPWLASRLNPPLEPETPPVTEMLSV